MFEEASGTLSDGEFLKAAAAEPKLASEITTHYKIRADDLLAALRQGLPHPLQDDAWNLIVDTLMNEGDVLSVFVGKGGDGAYPIQVVGIGNLCYVDAPEFDRVGVFPSIDLAEDFITENWADNLESNEPQRTQYYFYSVRPNPTAWANVPSRQLLPKPQIKILYRGYAKLAPDSFLAFQSSCHNQHTKFNAETLALHLFDQGPHNIKEVRAGLKTAGWNDVSATFEHLIDTHNKRK